MKTKGLAQSAEVKKAIKRAKRSLESKEKMPLILVNNSPSSNRQKDKMPSDRSVDNQHSTKDIAVVTGNQTLIIQVRKTHLAKYERYLKSFFCCLQRFSSLPNSLGIRVNDKRIRGVFLELLRDS